MSLGDIIYYIGMGSWLLFYFGLCIYQVITDRMTANNNITHYERKYKEAVAKGDDKAADVYHQCLLNWQRTKYRKF